MVKAFTIYGYENFIDSRYPAAKEPPVMLIAGDDAGAKETVGKLCTELGWKPLDTGPLASSLHLEHMTLLWIKMARLQGKGPGLCLGRLGTLGQPSIPKKTPLAGRMWQ